MGGGKRRAASLEAVAALVDRTEIDRLLAGISASARGEPGWPPLALFRALLLASWHDLSDVGLAEALEVRASFRRFRVNDQWRVCFVWHDRGAHRVEIVDYH